MNIGRQLSLIGICLFIAACVTVNVYFPAAAAEKAVDKFVKDVYGETQQEQQDKKEKSEPVDEKPSSNFLPEDQERAGIVHRVVNFVIPIALAAQPDIDIATPATNKLKTSMTARHQKLVPYYASGAVGMTSNALLVVRDDKAVSIKERNVVKQLVAEENRDRNQLYQEIAVANQHPEWEGEIRNLFARRWVANAPAGWWYEDGGWKQK